MSKAMGEDAWLPETIGQRIAPQRRELAQRAQTQPLQWLDQRLGLLLEAQHADGRSGKPTGGLPAIHHHSAAWAGSQRRSQSAQTRRTGANAGWPVKRLACRGHDPGVAAA